MSKYVFPAIFEPNELNGYCVYFPDFDDCVSYGGIATQGTDLNHAIEMAGDALCLALYSIEKRGEEIPKASKPGDIKTEPTNIVSLIACDTEFYKRYFESKTVKVNTTIPLWLKELGEKHNINFSQILQNGVKEYLQLK